MSNKLSAERKKELSLEVDETVRNFKREFPHIKSPIPDSYATIEELGFFIIGKHIDEAISGFHINIGEFKCIFVNRAHHYARQNQSLWHEVYHWYTGDIGHLSSRAENEYNEMEFKADNFASKILIDRKELKKKITDDNINVKFISKVNIIKLQNYFSASYMNVARALLEIYPNLFNSNRLNLGMQSQHDRLIEECKKNNLDYSIYGIPTTDYISPSFIDDLNENYKNGYLLDSYLESVLDLIDEELNLNEG